MQKTWNEGMNFVNNLWCILFCCQFNIKSKPRMHADSLFENMKYECSTLGRRFWRVFSYMHLYLEIKWGFYSVRNVKINWHKKNYFTHVTKYEYLYMDIFKNQTLVVSNRIKLLKNYQDLILLIIIYFLNHDMLFRMANSFLNVFEWLRTFIFI